MATVEVVNSKGKAVKTLEVKNELILSSSEHPLVQAAVVMQRASSRQGTSSSKGRGEVRGSGKKPWKQKHTGRARAGSNRSPIWRHGGIVFGPRPRKYGGSLPRKMYREAMYSAISSKQSANQLKVVEGFSIPEPKTRYLVAKLNEFGVTGKALIVAGEGSEMLFRAGRNLPKVKVVSPDGLNVYDILHYDVLLVMENDMQKIQDIWS
jgi:large subunit ribosomal protein L4